VIDCHTKSVIDVNALGIVLSPNQNGASRMFTKTVAIVCGDGAVELLGALAQLRRWFGAGDDLLGSAKSLNKQKSTQQLLDKVWFRCTASPIVCWWR